MNDINYMKEKYKGMPCRECLIKPICRTRIQKGVSAVTTKCSLIESWMDSHIIGSNYTIHSLACLYGQLSPKVCGEKGGIFQNDTM